MKRLSVILLSFLLYLPLCAQFKGTVYVDTNQSGTFDKGDKPLAGVMVTDGMNVVKTDKKRPVLTIGIQENPIYQYYYTCRIRDTTILPPCQGRQKKL